jgi:hypothetical protein
MLMGVTQLNAKSPNIRVACAARDEFPLVLAAHLIRRDKMFVLSLEYPVNPVTEPVHDP